MRNNATLQIVFYELENKGWTIHGTRYGQIYCTHPNSDARMGIQQAHKMSRHMPEIKRIA
jgi:hypothetical protein